MASHNFYSTGHQATIPTIRFEAAFVGLPGDMDSFYLPGEFRKIVHALSNIVYFCRFFCSYLQKIVINCSFMKWGHVYTFRVFDTAQYICIRCLVHDRFTVDYFVEKANLKL